MRNIDERELHQHCDRDIVRLGRENDSLKTAVRNAISELARWQYNDDPDEVRHAIDMAIRILEHG
jgi:hypothetical protein